MMSKSKTDKYRDKVEDLEREHEALKEDFNTWRDAMRVWGNRVAKDVAVLKARRWWQLWK